MIRLPLTHVNTAINKKGAGRPKTLKTEEEICLTILYLRQMPIFEVLGMMFGVSKTTANDTFHYWLPIFEDLLPSSLLEEWKRTTGEEELMKEFLTSYQLLVTQVASYLVLREKMRV